MANILVTAGPTREHLDDVRYLANGSSGRMGYAITEAALAAGHRVILVTGPTEISPPDGAGLELIRVVSAVEMHAAAVSAFDRADCAFGVAAVADCRPARRYPGKQSKDEVGGSIELVPNPDVIAALGAAKGARHVVGFALEATAGDAAIASARAKLERKRLDLCVLNTIEAMGAPSNTVTLVWADGRVERLASSSKVELGAELVRRVVPEEVSS